MTICEETCLTDDDDDYDNDNGQENIVLQASKQS